MKKRILSILLAVLMLVSVLPISALAAEGDASETPTTGHTRVVPAESDDKAVHVIKSVNAEGTELTLEAYATNSISTHTSYKPLDIVLVLDVSGSMQWCVNCNATYGYTTTGWSEPTCGEQIRYDQKGYAGSVNKTSEKLYEFYDGEYREVKWCKGHGWQSAGWVGSRWYDSHVHLSADTPLYTKTVVVAGGEHQHRIDALKTAVNTFIDSVASQKNSDNKLIDNRISIVTFGDSVTTVKGLTSASTNQTELKDAVSKLTAYGATRSDLGMKKAKDILESRTDKTRNSVVIMFTDGTPTQGTDFSSSVASAAISAAKAMKAGGTKIYTVGIFDGADPAQNPESSSTSNENKYMHAVSSNYPAASYVDKGYDDFWGHHPDWKWRLGDRAENSNYYLAASSSSQLSAIFQAISNEVNSLAVKIDTTSVLSDTLSDMFTFNPPEGAVNSGIKVYKQPVKADGTDDVDHRTELTKDNDGVEVTVTDKKLTVTGFDYGKNAVTTKTEGETTTYSGYKLVVTIPIKPDTGYTDWKYGTKDYPTNDTDNSKAGLEYGETGSRQKVELNDSPEAPVTAYTVSYTYTNGPTSVEAPKDRTAYIAGQTADVIEQTPTSVTENGYAYTFGGWEIGGDPAGTTIPITDHNVTITGNWTKEALTATVTITKEFVAPEGDTNFEVPTGLTLKLVPNDASKDPIPLTQVEGKSRYTASNIPAGTYTVEEEGATVTGYTYNSALTASGTTSNLNNDGTIIVAAGGTYTYNLTNTYTENPTTATVVITKKLAGVPEGTSVPAGLEIYLSKDGQTVVGPRTADTTGGDTFTITGLTAGTYEIGESKYDIDGYDWKSSSSEGFKIVAADYGTTKNVELTNTYAEKEPEPVKRLEVTKTADKQKGKVDEMITYTIEVKNTAEAELTDIVLTDTFGGTGTLYKDRDQKEPIELNANNGFTVEVGELAAGESKPYTYYYWIDERDEGVVTNVAVAESGDTEGSDRTETEVDRGDVDGYEVAVWIEKIVESEKGTFKKDASFTFDIWADETCRDRLSTVTISKEWDVLKDQYDEKAESFSFKISENDFEKLNTIDRCKVIYVTEREGSIKGMSYDSGVVTMYLVQIEAAAYSLHIGENDHYYATADLSYNNPHPAEFTNVYKKPAEKGETIKSGPQLNRDDHVAYIMGYPDGTVQPEGEITRAEACTIFFRLLTDSSRDYYFARTNDYSDVNAGDWFNNAISTLSNAGIVTGYNDGTFRPNQPITRGEMAKIIANFANLKYGGKTFTDLAGHWSKSYVELAAGNGWIAGYPDGSFRPDQKITRAETVTMINRVLDRVPAKESRLLSRSIMLTFPDNKPGDWYYIAIQEASNSHEYRRSVYETTGDEMWTKLIDNVDWTKLEK